MHLNRESRGQILVMSALTLPILIGMVALAVDVGFLFDYRRQAQTAADAGATGAALWVNAGGSTAQASLDTAARADTALNGFTHGTNGITVAVTRPPGFGYYATDTNYVGVVVSRPTPTFLMRILAWSSVNVAARAVAGVGSSRGCIYVLTTEGGKGLIVNGSAVINANNCEIYVNSRMEVSGSACVHADTINISGVRASGGCYGASTVNVGTPTVTDPLAYLPFPTTCNSASVELKVTGPSTPIAPGCYTKIEVEYLGGPVTFPPGEYHGRDGIFFKNGTTVNGTGVTFFVHTDKFELSGNATLEAPTGGTYPGMLVFLKKDLDKEIEIKNDSIANLTGTLYARSGKILYSGTSSGSAAYTILVTKEMLYSGIGTMNNSFVALPGGSPIRHPSVAD